MPPPGIFVLRLAWLLGLAFSRLGFFLGLVLLLACFCLGLASWLGLFLAWLFSWLDLASWAGLFLAWLFSWLGFWRFAAIESRIKLRMTRPSEVAPGNQFFPALKTAQTPGVFFATFLGFSRPREPQNRACRQVGVLKMDSAEDATTEPRSRTSHE